MPDLDDNCYISSDYSSIDDDYGKNVNMFDYEPTSNSSLIPSAPNIFMPTFDPTNIIR